MTIEIVDFPINHGDFPVRYVSLPHGNGKSAVNFEFFFVWEKHPNEMVDVPAMELMMTPEGISDHIIYHIILYYIM